MKCSYICPLSMNYNYFLLMALSVLFSCRKTETAFTVIKPRESGIDFNNKITEYDTFNILNTEFIYNGAGIAVGDLNGDGLEDLYFAGNQVGNRCYLNLGNLKFRDITDIAQVQKRSGQWSSGVNILDLNADGKKDIYVCNTLIKNPELRKNQLFINQGNNAQGLPIFKELSAEYGIDDTTHSSHAQFFDYDRDGDLDLFIGTNYIDRPVPGQFVKDFNVECDENCDKLYRNDWDSIKNQPHFVDVSSQAGMTLHGYSHSSLIYDFNQDGWQDIYVANDYLSDDLIYINNQDGTFTNKAGFIFRHQSSSAMGSDVGDINNDGNMEVITAEMLPFSNLRKKTLVNPANYSNYIYLRQYGYQYQFTRNTLQLNQGINPLTGLPVYDEIAFLAGVHETEWSWSTLFADFDLDGFQDLYITNGFPKDVTDHDFGEYRKDAANLVSAMDLQNAIPIVKVSNFLFHNNGDLTFTDVTKLNGIQIKSFSNGAAYADLDNDGDLDLVVNNIDDPAFLFRNNEINKEKSGHRFVTIQLQGKDHDPDAFGSQVKLYVNGKTQPETRYVLSGRGYLSESSNRLCFGLGDSAKIDSIMVRWPDGMISKHIGINKNTVNILTQKGSIQFNETIAPAFPDVLLRKISAASLGFDFKHSERDFIDFNIQKTVPHKMSQYGIPMAIGDINGDKLDDIILGGSNQKKETIFLQTRSGKYIKDSFNFKFTPKLNEEDAAIVLIDADQDHDLDLLLASGSYENFNAGRSSYRVRLFTNDGHGKFTRDTVGIADSIATNASTMRIADIDGDGDQDIFIAGQILPGNYPQHDRSFLLINNSSKGTIKFEDKTSDWFHQSLHTGIINDAIFSDVDGDSKPDLIMAIEWGPVTIYKNTGHQFEKLQSNTLDRHLGWWQSLTSGDFDNDGDMDYIAGNYGQNVYFKCNSFEPITIYAKDFDANGSLDPFISCYWNDTSGQKKEYFFHGRDDMIKQLINIKRKFQTYTKFGLATVHEVFSKEEMAGALILKANDFYSSFIRNEGKGQFTITQLPMEAQMAPLYSLLPMDLNGDNYLDLMVCGNDYGLELSQGRADAMQGLVLMNDHGQSFQPMSFTNSGYFVEGESRAIGTIHVNKNSFVVNVMNLDSLIVHKIKNVNEPNVASRKVEWYGGNSFKTYQVK